MIVVTGVDLGCFSKTASNKPRRPIDEIQRKYKKAHSNEASISKTKISVTLAIIPAFKINYRLLIWSWNSELY